MFCVKVDGSPGNTSNASVAMSKSFYNKYIIIYYYSFSAYLLGFCVLRWGGNVGFSEGFALGYRFYSLHYFIGGKLLVTVGINFFVTFGFALLCCLL